MEIPCKDCITFAICNAKDEISCSLLRECYYKNGQPSYPEHHVFKRKLEKLFNRRHSYVGNTEIDKRTNERHLVISFSKRKPAFKLRLENPPK